ncbi:MAG: cellulase family glycosylhydrolase, partial [Thermoplasmata archaeon]|nr:cellulase family glycosylhydrolase [Thermoplasmata archaeon]
MNRKAKMVLLSSLIVILLTIPFLWPIPFPPELETPDRKPTIENVTAFPDPQVVDGFVNITCDVSDDDGLSQVIINVTDPDLSVVFSGSMEFNPVSVKYYHNNSYQMVGDFTPNISVNDSSGNWAYYEGTFTIVAGPDVVPPSITDVTAVPNPQEVGGSVNVSAIVTDDLGVYGAWIDIRDPSSNPLGNLSMSLDPGSGGHFYESTYWDVGTHSCTIWANDTSNNWNSVSCSFSMEDSAPLSWLHVDGKYIKNELGETVWLRGAAFPDLSFRTTWGSWLARGGWDAYVNLSEGKANVIRVPMSPSPWLNPLPWPDADPSVYDSAIDQIVALAERDKVYLILGFHGGLSLDDTYALGQDPTPLVNWWLHWVERYKNNPIVAGFEIYNEPWLEGFAGGQGYDVAVANWVNVATQVVEAITAVNPRALNIVNSVPFSSIMQYWLDNPLPYNVAYGWDQYYRGWDEWHK